MLADFRQHYANLLTSGVHLVLLGVAAHIGTPTAWLACLGMIGAISFFAWLGNTRRRRLLADMPTSRIASAAQGYVELSGRARQHPEAPLFSRLKALPCVWYRYEIERRDGDGDWKVVEKGTSEDTFLLDDGSGQCVVDPDHAEVVTRHKQVWTENEYRYTEHLLTQLDTLHALGEFTTVGGANAELDLKEDVNDLLTEWKRDQPALLKRFDLDGDGRIDPREWELARLQARREVEKQHREIRLADGVNVLRAPKDGRLFLLSNLAEEALTKKYAIWGWAHLAMFSGAASTAIYLWLT